MRLGGSGVEYCFSELDWEYNLRAKVPRHILRAPALITLRRYANCRRNSNWWQVHYGNRNNQFLMMATSTPIITSKWRTTNCTVYNKINY